MESVTRNVAEIDSADRRAIERLIGRDLAEHQTVVISLVPAEPAHFTDLEAGEGVPEWWKVYAGLSDEDVDRLDQAIRPRANLTRTFE